MTSQLSALLARSTIADHDEALKTANAALKASKSDSTAQLTRVVALLSLDRFEDALRALDDGGDDLRKRAKLEHAYALYKAGELDEAEKSLGDIAATSRTRAQDHLAAQVAYKLEKFADAADVYERLATDKSSDVRGEAFDLRINSAAVDAQLEWQAKGHLARRKKPGREDLEGFESAYNAACGCVARGELGQAEVLLKRAKSLCEASEELSEGDKKAEGLPILVQLVYVLERLGREEDAEKLCSSFEVSEIQDVSTRHVAQVNALALSSQQPNPYLSHRMFNSAPQPPPSDRLFEYQSSILRRNAYIMDLLANKHAGVTKSTQNQLSITTAATINTISVLNAASHAHNATGKEGIKRLRPLLEKRPKDVGLVLTIVQLYLLTRNPGGATSLLESFVLRLETSDDPSDLDVRFAPGLVSTLISLYHAQGSKSPIITELRKAATHWLRKYEDAMDTDSGARDPLPTTLLQGAGLALLESLRNDDHKLAGEIFSALHSANPQDKFATAGLIASHADTAPEKLSAAGISPDALTPVARLVADVDAAKLEAGGVARPAVSSASLLQPNVGKKRPPAADASVKTKTKKIRRGRIPKDYDEKKTPDPERWLPLKDRSYWRPKGKKAKGKTAGLTQGGIVTEDKGGTANNGGSATAQPQGKKSSSSGKKKKGKK